VILPVDPSALGSQKSDHGEGDPNAIILEEVLKPVATKILVDFLEERFANVRGLRQRCSVRSLARDYCCRSLPFPTRDERKLAALV
jgi:hypothetical protein